MKAQTPQDLINFKAPKLWDFNIQNTTGKIIKLKTGIQTY